ncbi:MAG: hypothetical protein U9Q27_00890, partial [Patescibacteria group bacterium]|nr:hypothetical protein [Patescibacteria group bacterium]
MIKKTAETAKKIPVGMTIEDISKKEPSKFNLKRIEPTKATPVSETKTIEQTASKMKAEGKTVDEFVKIQGNTYISNFKKAEGLQQKNYFSINSNKVRTQIRELQKELDYHIKELPEMMKKTGDKYIPNTEEINKIKVELYKNGKLAEKIYENSKEFINTSEGKLLKQTISKTKSQLTDIWNKAKEVKPTIKISEKKFKPKKITSKRVKEFVSEKPAPFIRKRETTLLKDRIRNIQKLAISEANKKAKIQQLKNEFQIRQKEAVRKEQLKTIKAGITERIKGIAKGVRESRVLTKKEITANQTEIIDILDKSTLERSDKAKFIRAIKNVQTTKQFKKVLPKIQA